MANTKRTRVAEFTEAEIIAILTADPATGGAGGSVEVPNGDDAAVLATPSGRVVVATDVLVAGRHFRFDYSTPEQIAERAIAQNVADIAAMGAVPTGFTLGLGLPRDLPIAVVEGLARGLRSATARYRAPLLGGDVVHTAELTLAVTALGDTVRPITLAGARAGDTVALLGTLGYSAAGLAVLDAGLDRSEHGEVVAVYRVPSPPVPGAIGAAAMTDVSDGLLSDAAAIANASGVTLALRTPAVAEPVRRAAAALDVDPLDWVLRGGEDHPLLAVFRDRAPAGWEVLGSVVARGSDAVTLDGHPAVDTAAWTLFS